MSLRLPGRLTQHAQRQVEAVDYEIAQEKAAALGRISERLERALAALRAFDAARPRGTVLERDELVATAGEALWYYVVQREACGLRDTDAVLRELGVPREVHLRMGFRPARRGG